MIAGEEGELALRSGSVTRRPSQPLSPKGDAVPAFRLTAFLVFALKFAASAQTPQCRLINAGDDTTEVAGATPPRALRGPDPALPAAEAARAAGGFVELIFIVGCDGKVDANSMAVKSVSDTALLVGAISAMNATTFRPAIAKGKKVAMRILQRINFVPDVYRARDGVMISAEAAAIVQRVSSPNCPFFIRDSLGLGTPGLEPVRYLGGAAPEYPPRLKRQGIQGRVDMRIVVGCDGRVDPTSIIIVGSTDTAFTTSAVKVIVRARFSPATLNGRPVAQLMDQAVRFTLGGRPMPAAVPWWESQSRRP